MRLTDMTIKMLAAPERNQRTYFDDSLPGFGCRVTAAGVRSFVVVHGRNRQITTIGRYPVVSLSQARQRAREVLAERVLGKTHTPSHVAFGEAVETFLAGADVRERTRVWYRGFINRYLLAKFRLEPVERIATADLTRIIDKLARSKPSSAYHLHTVTSVFFNWAEKRRIIERSPLSRVPKPKSIPSRERVLSDDELVKVLRRAQQASTFGHIVQLLVFTGQRRSQIANLRREFIDEQDQLINWPGREMKTGRPHSLPMMPMVAQILSTLPSEGYLFLARGKDTPFSGFSPCKEDFDAGLDGVAQWTLHDLRRTFSTGLARLRVPPHIKEMLLAHASAKDPMEAIYDRYTYEREMREALERWEAHLQQLLKNAPASSAEAPCGTGTIAEEAQIGIPLHR